MINDKGISNIGALLLLMGIVVIISLMTYLGVHIAEANVP
ncbi:MAG TPA: hypothetical protein EYP30_00925 [Archaeoglobaceae archaeon]|nr:hypothetical protein [Archaeoglobaceae archaeon]